MAQINKPSDYFNTKLYTGNGSTQSITGVNFQPDWVWLKDRDNATNHMLFDSVRGTGKELHSQNTDSETTQANTLTAFGSDGFSLGNNTDVNNSSQNFVSWNWLADNTSGSSNTDGSITSTVSANTTSGFSIVSYTGTGANATIGHGLGSTPAMIIVKKRSVAGSWYVYHQSIGNTKRLVLETTAASTTDANAWNNTSPTSSVFSVGASGTTNASGATHIAYCFAEKKGFSKFGSYTGNGSTDGTFVYTGFKPAWVMIKNQTSGSYKSWSIFDTTRQTFNVNAGKTLYANKSSAEGIRGNGSDSSTTIPGIDMLSNGFKCRVLNDEVNNTNDFIYMAFAENPLVGTNNIPATAR